ncbi:polysaccharide pyruvyl transferase CsaB [Paenibacillus shirakamiensis]|uniref:Polysaccharide pyruvyl transferase CsaB n=1 Tax=Paenibacillus shirakamiensis TaxID=1265935 RepID=A0ABS4JJD4_9BACL|nr:polysaccharide pyruvyl transferase CsaB [Paenibacillus shirakamiensis]MBP2001798.1 polysaccharide pyruvyl transferase CsaB [Paenibacillus shirakamiensis]
MVTASAKRLVISGYYGFKNSGDEAVLKSILTALKQEANLAGITITPIVLSIDPEWTTSMYGVEAVHRMNMAEVRKAIRNSDGLISGGGSLLQDATGMKTIPYYLGILKIAQWMRKPTFIYAQGVGPVNKGLFRPFIASIFRKSSYISVRDTESAELLSSMGVPKERIEVVPDPVMGLPLKEGNVTVAWDGKDTLPTVGISVRFWNSSRTELKGLADGLTALGKMMPVHFRFLPFHFPGDDEASRYVMDQMQVDAGGSQVSITSEIVDPQAMLAEVNTCDALVGMRLHSLIYAASRYVPMLGISYDPKIDHFLARLGTVAVGTSEEVDPQIVASGLRNLLIEGEEWRNRNTARIDVLKQEARFPAARIVDYFKR